MKINLNPYADHTFQDDSWSQIAKEFYKANLMRKELAKRETFLKEKLKALSGNKSSRGGEFAFSKVEREGVVDYKEIVIQQLPQLNLEPYRKQSTFSWKITKL